MATATSAKPRVSYTAGLDLGRAWEHTALAVVERADPAGCNGDPARAVYAVRHLERFRPGTPYTDVFARVVALCAKPPLARTTVVVDYTAVGRAVVEALRRTRPSATLRPATVTAALTARPDERGGWLVPRTELVGLMQVLLQSGRMKVADALPEADMLVRELEAFRAEVPTRVDEGLAAWRERAHDDMVLAVALGAWEADRRNPMFAVTIPMVIPPGRHVGWWWSGLR